MFIVDENGNESVQQVVTQENNSKSKKQKTSKKVRSLHYNGFIQSFIDCRFQDEVDAGTNYYTKMFKIQSKLMRERSKLLRSKLVTEKLKQTLIQSKLSENQTELPALDESSESSSEDEENEENL